MSALRRAGLGLARTIGLVVLGAFLLWLALLGLYPVVDPPLTPLMLLRLPESGAIDHRPVALKQVAPDLVRAVIAAEDNRFCIHRGVDWSAVRDAVDEYEEGGRLRG